MKTLSIQQPSASMKSTCPYDMYDYEESELVVSILLNSEGIFNCSWEDKFSLFHLWIDGETPKAVKRKFLDALPAHIDRSWFKFSFCDEIEEDRHEEIEKALLVKGSEVQDLLDMCLCLPQTDEIKEKILQYRWTLDYINLWTQRIV